MKYNILEIIKWFNEQIKKGKAVNLCLQCSVRIEQDEGEAIDPIIQKKLEGQHLGHVRFYWNAGHNPVHSKAIASFLQPLLMLDIMNTKDLKLPSKCPKCTTILDVGSTHCLRCNWRYDPTTI